MTDWLSYEWESNGKQAEYKVDLQYWGLMPVLAYSQLIYVSCSPKNPTDKEFSRPEQHRVAGLEQELISCLSAHAIYAGSIRNAAHVQFYFYTASQELLGHISAICRTETRLTCTCGMASEPHYSSYYRLLFPDDCKLQSVENAAYIRNVVKHGGDTETIRRVILSFAFIEEEDRQRFIDEVPLAGFGVMDSFKAGDGTHPFAVRVTGFSSLRLTELNRFTSRAIRTASRHEGMIIDLNAEYIGH